VTRGDAQRFARCVEDGGVAVFPADTVYGIACRPDSAEAARRLYELKGREAGKPAAVMFFDRERALAALRELGGRTRVALERLLPGAVTVLLPNPEERFPVACASDPATLGLRVPRLTGALAPLAAVSVPVMQSSANASGGPEPRRLEDVPDDIRDGADLVLDGGRLPGAPSTVVDLRLYEAEGRWRVIREGAVPDTEVSAALAAKVEPWPPT
jgi:L-threonylcarbamoyladenylate synthase